MTHLKLVKDKNENTRYVVDLDPYMTDGELDYRRLIKDTIDDIYKNDPNLHVWNYVEYFEKVLDIKLDIKWKRFIRAYLRDLHRLRYFPNWDIPRLAGYVFTWEFIEFYLENSYKEFVSDINDPESIKKSRLDLEDYISRLRHYGLGFSSEIDLVDDNIIFTVYHEDWNSDYDLDQYRFNGLKEPQEEENDDDEW